MKKYFHYVYFEVGKIGIRVAETDIVIFEEMVSAEDWYKLNEYASEKEEK